MRPEGIVRESSAAVSYAGSAGLPAFNPDQHGDSIAEAGATRGGQRLVTYLRLAEVKPPSRLPLGPP